MPSSFTTGTCRSRASSASRRPGAVPIDWRCCAPRELRGRRCGRCQPPRCARRSPIPCPSPPRSWRRSSKSGPKLDEWPTLMRFWDASAIIPLLADEPARETVLRWLEEDSEILTWWGTPVEIASALARRERENRVSSDALEAALATARQLADAWHEIVPSTSVRRTAERLLRVHP